MTYSKRYFRIPALQSAQIKLDDQMKTLANIRFLEDLTGSKVKSIQRTGNLAFGLAKFDSVELHSPPTLKGWKLQKDSTNLWVPNLRTGDGKQYAEALRKLDFLGILSALDRAGVSPFYLNERLGVGYHLGVDPRFDEILLTWNAEAKLLQWPEWVEELKGSEYYKILEDFESQSLSASNE